ncbi:MAG TPA: nuclear transport factor 2 family protein [Dehalococcoidia bacterium]|nr:nuclear transport factor 2 family protein [Dehalococcoidia bacterium]
MVHPNEEIVRKAYGAFPEGETEILRQLFADGIIFRIPGRSPLAGEYRGRDAVFGYLGKVMDRSAGTFKLEVHDILANDQHVIGLTVHNGTRDGRHTAFRSVHVWHVSRGQLTELWEYPEQPAFDDFWS